MFISPDKMKPLAGGFKPRISILISALIVIVLLLTLQTLTGKFCPSQTSADQFWASKWDN